MYLVETIKDGKVADITRTNNRDVARNVVGALTSKPAMDVSLGVWYGTGLGDQQVRYGRLWPAHRLGRTGS